MSQNSQRLSWTFEEVDAELHGHHGQHLQQRLPTQPKSYGMKGNLVAGANIAGFEKVAGAMLWQGVV